VCDKAHGLDPALYGPHPLTQKEDAALPSAGELEIEQGYSKESKPLYSGMWILTRAANGNPASRSFVSLIIRKYNKIWVELNRSLCLNLFNSSRTQINIIIYAKLGVGHSPNPPITNPN
jgi:hypothetical protein